MCCDDQSRLGPKGRYARCMAIPALIVAVIGCFAIITHRLYGIFATGGAALGLVAPSLMLCDGARIKSFRLAACASFGSAALCSGGVAMLVYALTGISSFFERCLIELCQGPRWSFISESYVPGWQLAGCGSSCSHATICVITRDCTSEQDCMSNSRSIWHCNSLTQELLNVRQLAIFGARPLPRDERALRSLFRDFLTLSHAPNPVSLITTFPCPCHAHAHSADSDRCQHWAPALPRIRVLQSRRRATRSTFRCSSSRRPPCPRRGAADGPNGRCSRGAGEHGGASHGLLTDQRGAGGAPVRRHRHTPWKQRAGLAQPLGLCVCVRRALLGCVCVCVKHRRGPSKAIFDLDSCHPCRRRGPVTAEYKYPAVT